MRPWDSPVDDVGSHITVSYEHLRKLNIALVLYVLVSLFMQTLHNPSSTPVRLGCLAFLQSSAASSRNASAERSELPTGHGA
jgi:hypothetical protein